MILLTSRNLELIFFLEGKVICKKQENFVKFDQRFSGFTSPNLQSVFQNYKFNFLIKKNIFLITKEFVPSLIKNFWSEEI